MNRKWLALLAVLVLTGCSQAQAPESDPTPEPTTSPNQEACEEFSASSARIMDPFEQTDANALELWEDVRAEFDGIALSAEGDVKERMLALVGEWPEISNVLIYDSGRKSINSHFEGIARACSAEGFDLQYSLYSN